MSARRGHGGRRRAPAPHRCRVGNLALSAGLLRFEHCHLRVQLVHCRVFRADVSARRPRRGGGGGGGGGGGTRSAGLSMRSLVRASSSANGTSLCSGAVGAGGSGRLFSSFHFARRSALRVTSRHPKASSTAGASKGRRQSGPRLPWSPPPALPAPPKPLTRLSRRWLTQQQKRRAWSRQRRTPSPSCHPALRHRCKPAHRSAAVLRLLRCFFTSASKARVAPLCASDLRTLRCAFPASFCAHTACACYRLRRPPTTSARSGAAAATSTPSFSTRSTTASAADAAATASEAVL